MNIVMCSTALQMMSNPAPSHLTYAGKVTHPSAIEHWKRVSVPPPPKNTGKCAPLSRTLKMCFSPPSAKNTVKCASYPHARYAVIPTPCCEVWPRHPCPTL